MVKYCFISIIKTYLVIFCFIEIEKQTFENNNWNIIVNLWTL